MSVVGARDRQAAFAAHLRDPVRHAPPPGMDPARLAVYRGLFIGNIEGLLASVFPVLRSLYAPEDWLALVRSFYAQHHARTPYFPEIAAEFVGFLETAHLPRAVDPPFLRELAHYEWLELALDVTDEEIPATGFDAAGDLLSGIPVVNPLAVLARYAWPVHRVSPENPRPLPAETWLLVWRDREDCVRFQELNALSARLFTALRQNAEAAVRFPGDSVLRAFADSAGMPDAAVAGGACELLASWHARDLVLGSAGA